MDFLMEEIHQIHSDKTNMATEHGPGLKMYFLLKIGIFHCYMLVYHRLYDEILSQT